MGIPTGPIRYRDGVPVYRYDPAPGVPPVDISRIGPDHLPNAGTRHIHDFPVIVSDGSAAWVVQPGAIVDPSTTDIPHGCAAIAFDPGAVDPQLLGPTRHREGTGILHVEIPTARRKMWRRTLRQIEHESESRLEGYQDALVAHLSLLLIELRRHASDLADVPDESLQAVFTAIEVGFRGPLTLSDVAKTVGLTPGHLTTWVRKRTGKTVQEWIIQRKLAEARKLLAETELPVGSIARQVGFTDPAYFSRIFTREVGMAPRRWRGELGESAQQ
jgi:AraC family transcriptional activator of pobA